MAASDHKEEVEKQRKLCKSLETALEALPRARQRISRSETWSPEHLAVDATGRSLFSFDPEAVAWNASAALMRESPTTEVSGLLHERLRLQSHGDYLFANTRDHALVLSIFDRALAALPDELACEREKLRELERKK